MKTELRNYVNHTRKRAAYVGLVLRVHVPKKGRTKFSLDTEQHGGTTLITTSDRRHLDYFLFGVEMERGRAATLIAGLRHGIRRLEESWETRRG